IIKKAKQSIDTPIYLGTKSTMLHAAVSAGHPAVVRKLLELGANPDVRNMKGETPKDWQEKINADRTKKERDAINELLDNPPQRQTEPSLLGSFLFPCFLLFKKSIDLVSSLLPHAQHNDILTETSTRSEATKSIDIPAIEAKVESKTKNQAVQVEDKEKEQLA